MHLLLVIFLLQVPLFTLFIMRLRRVLPPLPNPNDLPRAAVVLAVRGIQSPNDKALGACLKGLFAQDHSNYQVWIVVDNRGEVKYIREQLDQTVPLVWTDPVKGYGNGCESRQQAEGRDRKVRVTLEVLGEAKKHRCRRTLKVAALEQAVEGLRTLVEQDRPEVIAFIDADVEPHDAWLRSLVAPFEVSDTKVGAVMGNRWYPLSRPPGADGWLVAIWNVVAVSFMTLGRIPWGGSLAINARGEVADRLLKEWKNAPVDDVVLAGVLNGLRRELLFVPDLLMPQEGFSRAVQTRDFMVRQMIWARLAHPSWPATVLYAFATLLPVATTIGLVVLGAGASFLSLLGIEVDFIKQWPWHLVHLVLYTLLMGCLFIGVDALARERMLGREYGGKKKSHEDAEVKQKEPPSSGLFWLVSLFFALLWAQIMIPFLVWKAATARKVWWSGVIYKITSDESVELEEYREVPNEKL